MLTATELAIEWCRKQGLTLGTVKTAMLHDRGLCCEVCEPVKWAIVQGEVNLTAYLEAGVRGKGGPADMYPDWVYESRKAIKHRDENVPWLPDLLKILGWQGGTVHQAMNAVWRLVEADKERKSSHARSELQQLVATLDRAGVGYGRRHDHNPPGEAVQIESGESERDFYVTEFAFDADGRLTGVTCSPGETG